MEISIDRRTRQRPRAGHSPAALGRWARDARSPSLRLTPAEVPPPPPDMTAPFTLVNPVEHATQELPRLVPPMVVKEGVIPLRPIVAREAMPFLGRTVACPYLEYRHSNRRCLSANPAPVSLRRQARYCMSARHTGCTYYRAASGLPPAAPVQAAFYTVAAVTLVLVIIATRFF